MDSVKHGILPNATCAFWDQHSVVLADLWMRYNNATHAPQQLNSMRDQSKMCHAFHQTCTHRELWYFYEKKRQLWMKSQPQFPVCRIDFFLLTLLTQRSNEFFSAYVLAWLSQDPKSLFRRPIAMPITPWVQRRQARLFLGFNSNSSSNAYMHLNISILILSIFHWLVVFLMFFFLISTQSPYYCCWVNFLHIKYSYGFSTTTYCYLFLLEIFFLVISFGWWLIYIN